MILWSPVEDGCVVVGADALNRISFARDGGNKDDAEDDDGWGDEPRVVGESLEK